MGKWTANSPINHEHDYPTTYAASLGRPIRGGEWTCDCGEKFVVEIVNFVADGRDGNYYEIDWSALNGL